MVCFLSLREAIRKALEIEIEIEIEIESEARLLGYNNTVVVLRGTTIFSTFGKNKTFEEKSFSKLF